LTQDFFTQALIEDFACEAAGARNYYYGGIMEEDVGRGCASIACQRARFLDEARNARRRKEQRG